MPGISRRTILKSIGLIGLAAAGTGRRAASVLRAQDDDPLAFPPRWNGEPLGRITQETQPVRAEPTTDSPVVAELHQDDVVRIRNVVRGQRVFWNSDLWLETQVGYLFASQIQPMWYHLPSPPRADLGAGRWAEVIVPYTDGYWRVRPLDPETHVLRARYGAVHRVTRLVTGSDGRSWYHAEELHRDYYLRATHLRLIPPEELAPISPGVPVRDKRIEINLAEQTLIAYEGSARVFAHHISSGVEEHETPEGVYYVLDKRPGDRMIGGLADLDEYDLSGVPFICYFTWEWVATHGCYWHNDWGRPRSRGCINLPSRAARWLWRWTTPIADPDELYVRPSNALDGTMVIVRA